MADQADDDRQFKVEVLRVFRQPTCMRIHGELKLRIVGLPKKVIELLDLTLVESTNKILSEYSYPLTLRQIHYRLVANGMIPNKRSAYNSLSKWLVKAREDGDVNDAWIEDRTRSVIPGVEGYDSPEEFIHAAESWSLPAKGDQQHLVCYIPPGELNR